MNNLEEIVAAALEQFIRIDDAAELEQAKARFLGKAGALSPDPHIRQEVDRESTALVEANKGMFDKLLFWQKPAPPGTVVDPAKEAQRLREASALGRPADQGKVPVIERKERGWLQGLF